MANERDMNAEEARKSDSEISREIFNYLRRSETESAMKLIDYAYDNEPAWIEFFKRRPDVLYDIRLFIDRVQYDYETDCMCANVKIASYARSFKRVSTEGKQKHKPYREYYIDENGIDYFSERRLTDESEIQVREVFYDNVPRWRKDMHKLYPNDFPIADSELFEEGSMSDNQCEIIPDNVVEFAPEKRTERSNTDNETAKNTEGADEDEYEFHELCSDS